MVSPWRAERGRSDGSRQTASSCERNGQRGVAPCAPSPGASTAKFKPRQRQAVVWVARPPRRRCQRGARCSRRGRVPHRLRHERPAESANWNRAPSGSRPCPQEHTPRPEPPPCPARPQRAEAQVGRQGHRVGRQRPPGEVGVRVADHGGADVAALTVKQDQNAGRARVGEPTAPAPPPPPPTTRPSRAASKNADAVEGSPPRRPARPPRAREPLQAWPGRRQPQSASSSRCGAMRAQRHVRGHGLGHGHRTDHSAPPPPAGWSSARALRARRAGPAASELQGAPGSATRCHERRPRRPAPWSGRARRATRRRADILASTRGPGLPYGVLMIMSTHAVQDSARTMLSRALEVHCARMVPAIRCGAERRRCPWWASTSKTRSASR